MTAKKIWANKFYHDSQEVHKNSQRDISWTSSDSEGEETYVRKKIKTNKSKSWIKASFTNASQSSDSFQVCISNETVTLLDTPAIRMSHFDESPIISSVSQEELSPILVEDSDVSMSNDEASPVIGKRGILKKVRSKLKRINKVKQNIFPAREVSPDIFNSQPSQLIDNCSPDPALCKTRITISQSSECLEPACSPQSSQITKDTSETNSSKTDNGSLYHRPVRKRKRYKKGGLASLLQKTLRLQKTRISRWQHEVYTKKSDILDLLEGETVIFVLRKFYREYGNTVLEAELLDEHECSVDSDLFQSCNEETNQFILVLMSPIINVTLIEGEKYQLFPPYCSKIVPHKSKNVVCYYGVSKIMVSKR